MLRVHERVGALAGAALADARGEEDLAALLEAVWQAIAEECSGARDADAPAPACGPGCAGCCRVNVGTLALEGAVIAARLRRTLAPAAAAEAAGALHAFHDRVRWLEDRERAFERIACPLLDAAGRCTVHPVRPLACRGLSSLDAGDCARAVCGEPRDDDEDAGLVRMDLVQRALHGEALAALAGALGARGLDARCRDVSGMTAAFLADPGLAGRFLRGERVPLA